MNVHEQIKEYIATQPEPKRSDMQELHGIILELMPQCTLWFLDGKDEKDQTVSNHAYQAKTSPTAPNRS